MQAMLAWLRSECGCSCKKAGVAGGANAAVVLHRGSQLFANACALKTASFIETRFPLWSEPDFTVCLELSSKLVDGSACTLVCRIIRPANITVRASNIVRLTSTIAAC